ncbi:MAG TPA: tetratricopeptide repeat protein [Pyrinomonadaceae bacterium]|nr:tetratricopeptide repeat protein [Pyrinomonadaceae bacterium]HMP64654.1 tetratricopeptide repeat protein [Pyrinomonadaceae bacterium]
MINKENILFCIVGLLGGVIIGFVFANSMNQKAMLQAGQVMQPNMGLPAGHPSIGDGQSGSIPEVQAAIDKARAEPENFDAQIRAAEMYYQIQRFDGAIEFLEQARKLKPDDYETIINLANAYFDSNKYAEAEKTYLLAIEKRPDDMNVRTDLGLTFVFRPDPDYDRAIKEFNTVLEKNPNQIQALQNLTVAYTKKGEAGNANATLERLKAAEPGNAAISRLQADIEKMDKK